MNSHIVMLVPSFFPNKGGVEHFVLQIAKRLVVKGMKVSVITAQNSKGVEQTDNIDGIDIYRFAVSSGWKFGDFYIPFTASLCNIISFLRYRRLISEADVVHCHDWGTFIYWYFLLRFIFFFKPVYITFYGNEGQFPISKRVFLLRKMAEWLTHDNICGGDYVKKWYKTRCDKVVYGGIELLSKTEQPKNQNSAVYVGRLELDTGILTYIEVVRILQTEHNLRFHLEIFGNGFLRDRIQNIVDQDNLDIKLHGYVSASNNSELFLCGNYAFVSQNLAMLEAMVARRLVFAVYDNPLKRDYVYSYPGADRLLVASGSPQEMVEKLLFYQNKPLLGEKIVNSAYEYVSGMTWDKAVTTHLRMYKLYY